VGVSDKREGEITARWRRNLVFETIFHAARNWHISACCESSDLTDASKRAAFSMVSFADIGMVSSSDESAFTAWEIELLLRAITDFLKRDIEI
jgi:hypothetical protein